MADEDIRELVVKARALGEDVDAPASIATEQRKRIHAVLEGVGVLEPPFDPQTLMRVWENSGALNPNIEAYKTNIDGFGQHLEPVIDLDSDEAFEQVREAMWLEAVHSARRRGDDPDEIDVPGDDEVEERIERLNKKARLERLEVEAFLETANPEGSFASLRKRTRQDVEITGNGFWEVLRDRSGRISRFLRVEPTHVRLLPVDPDPVRVHDRVPIGVLGWDSVSQLRFFRQFVQVVGNRKVYFKELGDPRVIGRNTGDVFSDIADFEQNKKRGDVPANELWHFKNEVPGHAYGVPRWIGSLLAVLGSRAADEVNWSYFDNKAIPPLALLVSGGGLSDESVKKVESYINGHLKGRENFHKILLIEAVSPGADDPDLGARKAPTISFEPLTNAQQGDALFQKYDERNIDKIGMSFRLPRLLRGDVRDFNRATAMSAIKYSDEQVFEPERNDFDDAFNRRVMPELGVQLWRVRSNGPRTRDGDALAEIVVRFVQAGIMTPNEGRKVAAEVLGRDLDPIDEGWARQPLQLTLAGFQPPEEGAGSDSELRDLVAEARRLRRDLEPGSEAGELLDEAEARARRALGESSGGEAAE